tara:strand:- start:1260 stop:1559 length:300 start_codon:yes stop_codon:yes gene_type:complete
MKMVLAVATVIFAMFVPLEALAGPNEKLHMACKDAIKLNLDGRAVLRGIDNRLGTITGNYRVRGSNGATHVTCTMDKETGAITLIDRGTKLQVALIAQL